MVQLQRRSSRMSGDAAGLGGWGGMQTTARLDPMLIEEALKRLAGDVQTPRDKLLVALEMYDDDDVALQQLTFWRRFHIS